jgi:hypothetical protein
MRRSLLISAVLLLALPAAAQARAPVNGLYGGIVTGAPNNEGEGLFCLRPTAGGPKIAAASKCSDRTFTKIIVPSLLTCNQLNASLEKTRLSATGGAFHYSGQAPIGPGRSTMNIRVKGTWVSDTEIDGWTRIWSPPEATTPCDTGKMAWTMFTPPSH